MTADDLTPAQLRKLTADVRRHLGYLTRLTDRMDRRGWRADDPIRVKAWAARDALHTLSVELHYASLPPGVAGKPQPPPPKNDDEP